MKIDRRSLTSMVNPYVCKLLEIGGELQLVAASEGYGQCYRFRAPAWERELLAAEPGGVLDITPLPGTTALYMIGGCYPGYDFHGAGVYLLQEPEGHGSFDRTRKEWRRTRVFDLPFAHRLQAVRIGGAQALIATSIVQTKSKPEEWGRPGAVYVTDFPESLEQPTPLRPILAELHKNHGFLLRREAGEQRLYITGVEGVFRAAVPRNLETAWQFERILQQEISELHFIDLDGDGSEELVTIEPFHGDKLVVYRLDSGVPEPWLEHSVSYGHGLWVGALRGVPSILVGNRGGDKNLELLQVNDGAVRATTIAKGTGTAQIAVMNGESVDAIFATNQEEEEVVRYTVAE